MMKRSNPIPKFLRQIDHDCHLVDPVAMNVNEQLPIQCARERFKTKISFGQPWIRSRIPLPLVTIGVCSQFMSIGTGFSPCRPKTRYVAHSR